MYETLLDTLVHTPWWVYVILVVILQIGFKSAKTSTVSLYKLCIAPIIFTGMAIETLINNLALTPLVSGTFAATLLIGILLGWWQVARQQLQFDRKRKLIKVPGTWSVMIVILIIFSTKYYFGYELSVDPEAVKNTTFEIAFISVTAICTGLFIGKFLCYSKRMFTETHIDL